MCRSSGFKSLVIFVVAVSFISDGTCEGTSEGKFNSFSYDCLSATLVSNIRAIFEQIKHRSIPTFDVLYTNWTLQTLHHLVLCFDRKGELMFEQ